MAYCPQCRYEYETEVMVCPDCNVTLVDSMPERGAAAMSPDRSWVVMGQVASQMKSEMAKGSLDSNNIPSVILSAGMSGPQRGANPAGSLFHGGAVGNVIMVPREFREDALIILEAVLGEDLIQLEP